jgi:hypothetical protein
MISYRYGLDAVRGEGEAANRLPLSAEKLNWNRLSRAVYAAGFVLANTSGFDN